MSKQTTMLLGVLVLLAIVAVTPAVYAYGIKYTDSDNPYGPLQGEAWGVGLGVAGLLAGIGIYTTRLKH